MRFILLLIFVCYFRSFQTQILQNELFNSSKRQHRHSKQANVQLSLKDKLKKYLVIFLDTSSVHGLNHLVSKGRQFFEVLLWLNLIALSIFGAVYLSRTTWLRYQESPTVVSMDRDMFAWNTSFPSVTICPWKKLDTKKLSAYVDASNEPDKHKLEDFIKALAKANYQNFDSIPEYSGIPSYQFMELLLNLSSKFVPTLTIGASSETKLAIEPTVTEMGLCYAINSEVALYNSPEYRRKNRWDLVRKHNETFFVHPLDGEVFAQVINMSTAYDVYIHGPLEVPDIATKHQHSDAGFYMKIYVTALSVYTSLEASKLTVAQRKCRFPEENILKHNAIYSYTMCRMECRIKLCLSRCNCIPHFYRRIGDEQVCDVKGLKCLAEYRDELYKLLDKNGQRINCECLPLCDDVNYVISTNGLQEWFLGTNFQWGIMKYPRMRYRRDIIFGFTDVLVSVGSMAGLFLGCSVLSFMEIIYFLTLRFFWYFRGSRTD